LINDLMITLAPKVNPNKVVSVVEKLGHLPLIKKYLTSVQETNSKAVNEALNAMFIEEDDYEALQDSISRFDNYDALKLAKQVEKHELIEFRRIAATIYKKNNRFEQSVELSKKDGLYQDAITTVAESGNKEVAESLLSHFLENNNPHCFAATLYTCYDLVRPDVVLELAWRFKALDFIFPYLVQFLREYTTKVDTLASKPKKEEKEAFQTGPVDLPTQAFLQTNPLGTNPQIGVPIGVVNPLGNPQILNSTGHIGLSPLGMAPLAYQPGLGTNPPVNFPPNVPQTEFGSFVGFQ